MMTPARFKLLHAVLPQRVEAGVGEEEGGGHVTNTASYASVEADLQRALFFFCLTPSLRFIVTSGYISKNSASG